MERNLGPRLGTAKFGGQKSKDLMKPLMEDKRCVCSNGVDNCHYDEQESEIVVPDFKSKDQVC